MKKRLLLLPLVIMAIGLYGGCKKTSAGSSAAQALSKRCTHPLISQGDSSIICYPTAFTPNGDGVNDVYGIIGSKINSFSSFQENIYKTNGSLVIQTTDPRYSWNGADAAGNMSTPDKYYVTIKYTSGNISVDTGTYVYLLSSNAQTGCINAVKADSALYIFPDQIIPATGEHPYATGEHFCN